MSAATAEKVLYADARESFERNTTKHVLTVLHDDGLYRHIRLAEPGTGMWHYDLVTWPGHLSITGDIGNGYTFSRIDDMFDFFHRGAFPYDINPQYWAEKLPHAIQRTRFSEEVLREKVRWHSEDYREELDADTRDRFDAEISALLDDIPEDSNAAYNEITDFRFRPGDGTTDFEFNDVWDWGGFDDWDFHFLLACFAIVRGIEQYKAAKS